MKLKGATGGNEPPTHLRSDTSFDTGETMAIIVPYEFTAAHLEVAVGALLALRRTVDERHAAARAERELLVPDRKLIGLDGRPVRDS